MPKVPDVNRISHATASWDTGIDLLLLTAFTQQFMRSWWEHWKHRYLHR